jgi:hypothetical protein
MDWGAQCGEGGSFRRDVFADPGQRGSAAVCAGDGSWTWSSTRRMVDNTYLNGCQNS